jgi:hypothetical protein
MPRFPPADRDGRICLGGCIHATDHKLHVEKSDGEEWDLIGMQAVLPMSFVSMAGAGAIDLVGWCRGARIGSAGREPRIGRG